MLDESTSLDRVLGLAELLSPTEQLELIAHLSERLRRVVGEESREPVDMLSLAGLGAELWQGIDVDAYLRKQRESWER